MSLISSNVFECAARNLAARYYRRFPHMRPTFRWDATSIKDRWYKRGTCKPARERLA